MSREIPDHGSGERGVFVYDADTGKFVKFKKPKKVETHAVFTDEVEPFESMATNERQIFTSKSKYRRHLRALGFRESGGDHLKPPSEAETTTDREREDREWKEIAEKAYYDVKYGRVEFTEAEKEKHLREMRQCPQKLKPPI